MKSKQIFWTFLGLVLGLTLSFLNSDIHFYLIRNYVSAFVAIIIGFSAVWFFAPRKN